MRRRAALLALPLWLSACTTPRVTTRPGRFWSGRLALQVMSEPPQSFHAGFELQGSVQEGELTLLSPVGGVLARLLWNPGQAILERGSERWSGQNVEELSLQLVQTALPIQTVFDWIAGRPTTHAGWEADLSAHDQGRIVARRLQPAPAALLRIVLDP